MFKLWAKVTEDNKLIKDYVLEISFYNPNNLHEYLVRICDVLDIPTPIILFSHANNFDLFNNTYFTKNDFVEKIYFERLIIENITE